MSRVGAIKLLVVHGANINWVGRRQPEIYGTVSIAEIDRRIRDHAASRGVDVEIFQSNSEGEVIDRIYRAAGEGVDALVMNPGGFTYGSYALRDALLAVDLPYIEVHLSNLSARKIDSVQAVAAKGIVMGLGGHGYLLAIDAAIHRVTTR